MSTFDGLPHALREWLRRNRPGARINVPKELSASERAARAQRIRRAYRAGIEAGADSARLIAGLAAEFRLRSDHVRAIVLPETGNDLGP